MTHPASYRLQSVRSGNLFDDPGWALDPPGEADPSLIRTVYPKRQLCVGDASLGLYRFADWLPVRRFLNGSSAPVTYRSNGLASAVGLSDLWITFSGYWPEKGATMRTCSFKETEAYSVCGRLDPDDRRVLVVASAGNTARAFARVCSDNDIPLLLCMPFDTLDAMWFDEPVKPCVRLAVTGPGSDYFDAIRLSNLVCADPRFLPEGGARNVARRDGMGTTVLSAVTAMGRIPQWYFQAVGSGTGAIAAWEANLRLIADGRFGDRRMTLMVSQNEPFVPMAEAWRHGSRDISIPDDEAARGQVAQILAKVLSNRKPPYGIAGGLFDAMQDAGGDFLTVVNEDLLEAAALFEMSEGIDIHPAAAVAVASLRQAVETGRIGPNDAVMLNITGGGEARMKKEHRLFRMEPGLVLGHSPAPEEVREKIPALFGPGF